MKFVNNPTEIEGIRVVQDYEEIETALINGETVLHWEGGDSLAPIINHLEYCKISPINIDDVKRGDCVFCKMQEGYYMVHQVWEISDGGHDGKKWFKIGSTMTSIFGWTQDVIGIAKGTDIYQNPRIWKEMVESEEENVETV